MKTAAPLSAASPPLVHGWFYDYQTIIAGVLALVAALIAAEIARRQLRAARDQLAASKAESDRDRSGRLRAARASLPAVLSAICDYAEAAGRTLDAAWPAAAALYPDEARPFESHRITAAVPSFPAGTLQALERVVELTDSDPVADRIESILREAQVLGARTRKLATGDDISTENLAAYILQAASIYARSESLFDYARRQRDGLAEEPLWTRAFAALSVMGINRDQVTAMAHRERDRGDPPGEADTPPVY